MDSLSIGHDAQTDTPWLKYRRWNESLNKYEEWSMTPPPHGFYPYLFKVALRMARLNESILPMQGTIPAREGRRQFNLFFSASSLDHFIIAWERKKQSLDIP